jgi:tRNA-specific 2-thiouridylase
MTKDEVRERAGAMGLPSAANKESQEVCFIPDNDYRGFIEKERPDAVCSGEFVDASGNVLGRHRGVAFYTVGQRKGLGVSSPLGRRYVLDRDVATNRVVLGEEEELKKSGCVVATPNWIAIGSLVGPLEAEVKLRYRFKPVRATLTPEGDGVRVTFKTPEPGVSPGQSAVFYDGDAVIGGGVINRS